MKVNDLKIGEEFSYSKTVTEADVVNYAGVIGDFNPAHVNESYAQKTIFKGRIAHGMLTAGFISSVLGMKLSVREIVYVSQTLKFKAPVQFGDTITAMAEIINKNEDRERATLKTICTNQKDKVVLEGEAVIQQMPMG